MTFLLIIGALFSWHGVGVFINNVRWLCFVDRAAAYVHKGAKFPHPQTYLFTATMSKDVTKLRRAALDRDAVVCQGGGAGTVEGSDGTAGSRPQSSFETDLPAGLRHFCLPTRRTDKLATLDWVLEKAVDAENKGEEEDAQSKLTPLRLIDPLHHELQWFGLVLHR